MVGTAVAPKLANASPVKRRNRSRLLPPITDRRTIALNISPSLDMQLEIMRLVEGKIKNEVFFDSIQEFLKDARSSREPLKECRANCKVRVTLILTEELEASLRAFVENRKCTVASAVTTALAWYFKRHYQIDLLKDPYRPDRPYGSVPDRIIQALRA